MKKISELTATTTANTGDYLVINNSGVTKKITVANFVKNSSYFPFKLAIVNSKYGYYKTDGTTFVEF